MLKAVYTLVALAVVHTVAANPLDTNLAYRSPFIDKPHVSLRESFFS